MKKKAVVSFFVFVAALFAILLVVGLQTKSEVGFDQNQKIQTTNANGHVPVAEAKKVSWPILLAQRVVNFITPASNSKLSPSEPMADADDIENLLAQIPDDSLPVPRGVSVVSMSEQKESMLAQVNFLVGKNFEKLSFDDLSGEERLERFFSAFNFTEAEKEELKKFVRENQIPSDLSEEDKEGIKNFDSLSDKKKKELKERIKKILANRVTQMFAESQAALNEINEKGYIETTNKQLQQEMVPLKNLKSAEEVEIEFVPANVTATELKSEGAISYDGVHLIRIYSTPSGEKVQITEWERGGYGGQLLKEMVNSYINGYPAVYVIKKNTESGKEVGDLIFFSDKKNFELKATSSKVDLVALARSIRD